MAFQVDPQARFWAHASVALAKSALLLASAQDQVRNRNQMTASILAYYGLFHLGLSFVWLLPEQLDSKLHQKLVAAHDAGKPLPDSTIGHRDVERFIRSQSTIRDLYQRALATREFVNYGPRIRFDGSEPVISSKEFAISDARELVKDAIKAYAPLVKGLMPRTAYRGHLAYAVRRHAADILSRKDLPLGPWCSRSVVNRAKKLLNAALAKPLPAPDGSVQASEGAH